MAETLLKVSGLQAWYGESHILHGMEFEVPKGEVVTLLGRNGVGKTTTLRAIMGLVGKRTGSVTSRGRRRSISPPTKSAAPASPIARRSAASSPV